MPHETSETGIQAQKPDRMAESVDSEAPPRLSFPVVGLGASAGGLEACIDFFKAMPADSGMAFVLIQHLPPERESMVTAILAKHTAMTVLQVEDGMLIEPNRVYAIRPGRTLTISDGRLRLGEPVEKRGHRRPVDDFFRSLAAEQRERAIAVIFSGMGSNGTAGAQVIKAVGGLCIAQDPETAKFPAMPRSLIDAGLADFILKPDEVPAILIRYSQHPYVRGEVGGEPERERQALNAIIAVLRARVRHDFSGYKKPTVLRRIQRRMGLAQITSMQDYARTLRQNPNEATALADDLMIHVTGFFRDADVWETLRSTVIAPLVNERRNDSAIRAWVTACSSGEEAYTLAILLVEAAEAAGKIFNIKIFATDTAERSLGQARAGIFPGGIESEISTERLNRFFDREEAVYRVKKEVRELVVFAPQNVLQDPPFSRLDICTCRNLLIYLEPELQRRALLLMHFGLVDGGVLMLGSSETIGGMEELFEPVDKKVRIYRRVGPTRHGAIEFPLPRSMTRSGGEVEPAPVPGLPRVNLPYLAQQALLDRYSPPSVVIDRQQRIVFFHGRTARFLDQPRGEPTRELLTLVREPLRGAVRTALHHALAENKEGKARNHWIDEENVRTCVEVTVAPLGTNDASAFFLVSFQERMENAGTEASPATVSEVQNSQMAEELRRVTDELQSTIEELQTANEEMKASHEETTSINEELQSTNEELETSKEELQSLNEELTTVNTQLQVKMEELEATTNDLSSLLSSTDIAVIFLDTNFRVRRFTPAVKDLIELIASDVGRPLSDLSLKFDDPDFLKDTQTVLEKLAPIEHEVTSESGRAYVRRTLPYRTADNRIDGVVITFVDITRRLKAEADLRESEERHRLILNGVKEYAIVMLDADGKFATWPAGAERMFGYSSAEALGKPMSMLLRPEDRTSRLAEEELARAKTEGSASDDRWHRRKDGADFWGSGVLAALRDQGGKLIGYVKVLRDNTDRKLGEDALLAAKNMAEAANAAKDHFLATVSHELRTPLAAMMLWTKLLEDNDAAADPTRLREGLDAIRSCAEEQHELIEDLLDTSRIVAGKLRLELKVTDLLATVRAAVDSIRPGASSKNVFIEENLASDTGFVRADAHRLQQVVWNLLTNAVKFTPPGGRIRVGLRRQQDDVEITVADTGEGIAAEFLPQMFERFMQADESGKRTASGLGLGLSIAKQLVELHGGTIRAQSGGVGKGAEFKVWLPLPAIDPSIASTGSNSPINIKANLKGLRVMLLEDKAATRRALTMVLREAGADVVAFDGAPEALQEFPTARPNLILSDLGMSVMDGHEFITKVRAFERAKELPPTPAVAFTAYADEKNRGQALASGFQKCLTKPVDATQLISVLARFKTANGKKG